MYRTSMGGGISVDVHSGGIIEYLPLLYLVLGRHGYRRIGVTVATVVVAAVMVALAALRGGIWQGVVGRARVLGRCGRRWGGLSAGGHGDGGGRG